MRAGPNETVYPYSGLVGLEASKRRQLRIFAVMTAAPVASPRYQNHIANRPMPFPREISTVPVQIWHEDSFEHWTLVASISSLVQVEVLQETLQGPWSIARSAYFGSQNDLSAREPIMNRSSAYFLADDGKLP